MDYLSREAAPFGDALWEQIDTTIVETLRSIWSAAAFCRFTAPLAQAPSQLQLTAATRMKALRTVWCRPQDENLWS